MKSIDILSTSSNQTMNIAKTLAKYLSKGDTVVLTGELGSGKTKFTEGFLAYYGLEEEISSPTFNIVNEYISNSVNIYHFDVYRLDDSEEFINKIGTDYFEDGISIIEWGNIIKDILPRRTIYINIEKSDENPNKRIIKIKRSQK